MSYFLIPNCESLNNSRLSPCIFLGTAPWSIAAETLGQQLPTNGWSPMSWSSCHIHRLSRANHFLWLVKSWWNPGEIMVKSVPFVDARDASSRATDTWVATARWWVASLWVDQPEKNIEIVRDREPDRIIRATDKMGISSILQLDHPKDHTLVVKTHRFWCFWICLMGDLI